MGKGIVGKDQGVGKTWPVLGRLGRWWAVRSGRPADVNCWNRKPLKDYLLLPFDYPELSLWASGCSCIGSVSVSVGSFSWLIFSSFDSRLSLSFLLCTHSQVTLSPGLPSCPGVDEAVNGALEPRAVIIRLWESCPTSWSQG